MSLFNRSRQKVTCKVENVEACIVKKRSREQKKEQKTLPLIVGGEKI